MGAGPAGAAAALQLAKSDPALARRTLLIDAEPFPREKLCGGGLIPESDRFLAHLEAECGCDAVPIRRIVFEYPGGRAVNASRRFFRVVHRRQFDQALVETASARGVEVRTGDAVEHLERDGERICLGTRSGVALDARVLIGADGARSSVRRALVGAVRGGRFVALETLSPGHDGAGTDCSETAVFDFRPAASGLRGYAWHFPSLRHGRPWMNRGLGGAARSGRGRLRESFEALLEARGIGAPCGGIQGGGAPFYDARRPQGAERVLLAGDAVGIDPWFGEGISVALGTGILAAHAAMRGLASGDFGFEDHGKRIADSAVGWTLRRKQVLAELFYPLARIDGGMGVFLGAGRAAVAAPALEAAG